MHPTLQPPSAPPGDAIIALSHAEHLRRQAALVEWMQQTDIAAVVLFERINLVYLTGYHFQQTERPVAWVLTAQGAGGLLTPALEADHAGATPTLGKIMPYPEYPGLRHPMHFLGDLLADLGVETSRLAADQPGYPPVWGYQGPTLAELVGAPVTLTAAPCLLHARSIKSAEVIDWIHVSAAWGHYAHALLHAAIRPGGNEVEIGQAASRTATLALFAAFGTRYRNHDWGVTPIHTGFKAGPDTAVPHPMGGSRALHAGDVIVTWATAKMAGYHAELERTLILGEPSADQRHFFAHACAAQAVGIAAIRPGARCAEVDEAVYAYWAEHNLLPYVRHHTGHGLDMEIHAPPFLDRGDTTLLEPGMLFSVEPGLYVPGLGGFRHSDTVLVTAEGHEVLTSYPRDLASLTIPLAAGALPVAS
jgi:Xaa-Pro aminopeptidase